MPFELQRRFADSIIQHEPLNELRIQLACGARVNEPVVQGLRPLHYAVYENYEECVKLLLVRSADVEQRDNVGYTPLHLAAERGYYDLCVMLIQHGSTVNFSLDYNKYGADFELFPKREHLADEPLRLAIKNGHYEIAELLLENGADPNTHYFLGAELNLAPVAKAQFIELLLRYGAYVDSFDRYGMTPLMKACKAAKDCLESVLILLSYQANVNCEAWSRQENRSPLHFAVIGGSLEIVLLLIKQGASVVMPVDYERASPLDLAILRDDLLMVHVLLHYGGAKERDRIVNRFSAHLGTALHVAAVGSLTKQEAIIRLLLENGASVNAWRRTEDGANLCTPIVEYLASRDVYNLSVINVLLDYGATVSMASPAKCPTGILRSIRRMRNNEDILARLLPFVGHWDVPALRTYSSRLISDEHRALLLCMAEQPRSLREICRFCIRRCLKKPVSEHVEEIGLPKSINSFLKVEDY